MLIDLHTHTLPLSLDSGLKPVDLLTLAKVAGLDGVCLTEHNAVWNKDEAAALAERFQIAVFRGMEVGTAFGHVLVFGLEHYTDDMMHLDYLRDAVREAKGAMVLAHPHRHGEWPFPFDQLPQWFHGIETLNGSDANDANSYLVSMAAQIGLPGTGGSDAHSRGSIGSCATQFEHRLASDADLVRELRAQRCSAVRLRATTIPQ